MNRYKKYIKPYLPSFILGPIMMLSEVFGEIWLPRLMSMIINQGVANHDVPCIIKIGLVMLGACCLMIIGGTCGCYFAAKASIGFSGDLRKDLFDKVQSFSFSNLDDFSTGSLITRLTNDVQQVQNLISMGLKMALRSPGLIIGALIMAVQLNRSLAVVLLIVIPLLGICVFLIMRAAHPRFMKMQKSVDGLNNDIQEALTNVRVVKSFVREDHEIGKFAKRNDRLRERTLGAMNLVVTMGPCMMFFMHITSAAVVWYGGNKVIAGTMQVGDLTAFITYISQVLMNLMMLAMVILMTARSTASFRRISEVLDTVPDITDAGAACPDRKPESGSVEFRDVSFRYPAQKSHAGERDEEEETAEEMYEQQDVLEHISFRIESGETIGILGATGCGKTSLVQLIPRLFDVTEGQVLVDGTDVRDYNMKNLRDGVSMVLQNNTLFCGTVAENLRWGNEDASEEEVRAAASAAEADGFVSEFPEGYERMIEQGGTNVSGGQKQRLCIARALLRKPKILILDDSTSAVDTATEARIRESFAAELKDTTKIIIAQRIGSVKDADRIIVMDDGRIADIGTHGELMERCAQYREIYYSQVERGGEVTA